MKTVNKYGLEYAGPRRARRGAMKQRMIDLVIGAVVMALLWWLFSLVSRAATVGDVMPLRAQAGKPMLQAAGFGLPEWVAAGIVGVIAALMVWRLICGVRQDADDEHHHTSTVNAGNWLPCLMEWFARRHVMLSHGQAMDIRTICVPDHRRALVELDQYLRQRMKLRLWMTSLLEVQQICLRSEPEMVVLGKEGEV